MMDEINIDDGKCL